LASSRCATWSSISLIRPGCGLATLEIGSPLRLAAAGHAASGQSGTAWGADRCGHPAFRLRNVRSDI
jgi:hypothetical protein